MPLTGDTATATATTTTLNMEAESNVPIRRHAHTDDKDVSMTSLSPSIDYEFDESQCLFCNQTSLDLDQNLVHMSKSHGLHIDSTNLLVDVASLLAYLHLVISSYYECLFCGTQRNTRQAVQQHMIAKGHCKYDITDKDAELRDFYEFPSSDEEESKRQHLLRMSFSDNTQQLSTGRPKKTRPSTRMEKPVSKIVPSSSGEAPSTASTDETLSDSWGELSTRALKQADVLHNQLTQLRAGDRRSLLHLPGSQQRALLATHHKQMEKARRSEQTQRSNLETAGNKVNCLDKIRLIRKPPHTGNVFSLNR